MTRIQHWHQTAAQWLAEDPVLAMSEYGDESDTGKRKRGNGVDHWSDLGYEGNDAVGTSLTSLGLTNSTTDIGALINAAFAAGITHVIVPYRATPWPSLTRIIGSGVWLEFEAGAQISHNHNNIGMNLDSSRLTNAAFTSIHTGPASVEDATSPTYGYPARSTVLGSDCLVDGTYSHECATQGIAMVGSHIRIPADLTFRNIRHQQGWAHIIHGGGPDVFDVRVTGSVSAEDCDRAIECEDGTHDVYFTGGGHLKNIFPNGYTGSGSALTYANYTFVLDAHAHTGTGGVYNIHYGNGWIVENCGGGVTFIRSNGTNDSDLPRNCSIGPVKFVGRGLASGYKDVDVQGRNNRVGVCTFEVGAGVAGGSFYVNEQPSCTDCFVEGIVAEGSAVVAVTGVGKGLRVGRDPLPVPSALRASKFIALPNRPNLLYNALGNGTLRTTPVYIPATITIDQLGVEVTVVGDSGSVMRIGIFNDKAGLPGSPLADVTVATDAVATPMATLGSALTLSPGWYHVGGCMQNVTSVQPTVRCHQGPPPDQFMLVTPAVSALFVGYSKSIGNAALSAYGTTISTTAIAPRILARLTS